MENTSKVIRTQDFENRKRHLDRDNHLLEKENEIPERYSGDIKRFITFCNRTDQNEVPNAMLDYMYRSLMEERVKLTTWERRLAAIKKYLSVKYGFDFQTEVEIMKAIYNMRKIYKEEQNTDLTKMEGKYPVDKEELLEKINGLDTREKAICLINLVTANRPNEMVRMKIKDFHLELGSVSVYLKKQKQWHDKRLTLDAIKAVEDYIKKYDLKDDDYFVGHVLKNGVYESKEISDTAYRKNIKKWINLSPYNFRKTQVSSMHVAGADLSTIAKQTGHTSIKTLDNHYLNVADATVDKFL